MSNATVPDSTHRGLRYSEMGYAMLPGVVSADIVGFLINYLDLLGETGRLTADRSVEGSSSIYGDPAFDTILSAMAKTLGAFTGIELVPTYSFARIYMNGHSLHPHVDRPACEHSATVHLGSSDSSTHWPIELAMVDGGRAKFVLEPGDVLLYRGMERAHWRDRCPVDWYAQLFLHFVDVEGPHSEHRFDKRPSLGVPRSTIGGQT